MVLALFSLCLLILACRAPPTVPPEVTCPNSHSLLCRSAVGANTFMSFTMFDKSIAASAQNRATYQTLCNLIWSNVTASSFYNQTFSFTVPSQIVHSLVLGNATYTIPYFLDLFYSGWNNILFVVTPRHQKNLYTLDLRMPENSSWTPPLVEIPASVSPPSASCPAFYNFPVCQPIYPNTLDDDSLIFTVTYGNFWSYDFDQDYIVMPITGGTIPAQQFRFQYKSLAPCFASYPNTLQPDDNYALMPMIPEVDIKIDETFGWNPDRTYHLADYSFMCFLQVLKLPPEIQALNLTDRGSRLKINKVEEVYSYSCLTPFMKESYDTLREYYNNMTGVRMCLPIPLIIRADSNALPDFSPQIVLYPVPNITSIQIVDNEFGTIENNTAVQLRITGTGFLLSVPSEPNIIMPISVNLCETWSVRKVDIKNSTTIICRSKFFSFPPDVTVMNLSVYLLVVNEFQHAQGTFTIRLKAGSMFLDHLWYPILSILFLLGFFGLGGYYCLFTERNLVKRSELKYTLADLHGISKKILISPSDLTFERKIGRGGFATVWLGIWKHKEVAVKKLNVFDGEDEHTEEMMEEYFREATIMIELRHQNVVALLGLCMSSPDFLIVTEYMELGTLTEILMNKKYIIEDYHKKNMAIDCCCGMVYLHSLDLIHRDLKGKNLLVDRSWNVKVADFGLSKFVEGINQLNQTMTGCGTPVYAAPEILRGEKYSTSADVYSFAIVLLEIWTRNTPFKNIKPYQVILGVSQHKLRPTLPDDLPLLVIQLITECWDDNSKKRPSFEMAYKSLEVMQYPDPETQYPYLSEEESSVSSLDRSNKQSKESRSKPAPKVPFSPHYSRPSHFASGESTQEQSQRLKKQQREQEERWQQRRKARNKGQEEVEDPEEKAVRIHLQQYASMYDKDDEEIAKLKSALRINNNGEELTSTSGSDTVLSSISHVDLGEGKEGNTSTSTNALFPYLGGATSAKVSKDPEEEKL